MNADLLITRLLEATASSSAYVRSQQAKAVKRDTLDVHDIGFIHPDGKVTLYNRRDYPLHNHVAELLGMKNESHAVHVHGAVRVVVARGNNWIGLTVHKKHKQAMRNAADFIEKQGEGKHVKLEILAGRKPGASRSDVVLDTKNGTATREDVFRALRGEEPRAVTSVAHVRRSPEFREPAY